MKTNVNLKTACLERQAARKWFGIRNVGLDQERTVITV